MFIRQGSSSKGIEITRYAWQRNRLAAVGRNERQACGMVDTPAECLRTARQWPLADCAGIDYTCGERKIRGKGAGKPRGAASLKVGRHCHQPLSIVGKKFSRSLENLRTAELMHCAIPGSHFALPL